MPRYRVKLPVSGYVETEIEDAESAEDAIDKALAAPFEDSDIVEWGTHEHIVRGHVCFAILFSAEATELSE